jgi:hypothetical protein
MYSSQTFELDLMLEDLRDPHSVGLFAGNANAVSFYCVTLPINHLHQLSMFLLATAC